jgi:hypothetical protein
MFSLSAVWRLAGSFALLCMARDSWASSPAIEPEGSRGATIQALTKALPLVFERNQGQADASVMFVSRGLGYQFFLTRQEAVMVLENREAARSRPEGATTGPERQAAVVRMRFEGSNPEPAVEGLERLGFTTNYFIGDAERHVTGIANHAKVKYSAIYPGIDLVFYGNREELEYDLIVAPHAGPERIAFSLAGAEQVSVSGGELRVRTSAGDLMYRKPVAYQTIGGKRTRVDVEYVLADNGGVRFRLGKYDTNEQLIIDPILSYSSFLYGHTTTGVAVDSAGNTYAVGSTTVSELPLVGGYKTTLNGSQDAYLVKIDPTGTRLLYATYLGVRRSVTSGHGVAIDASGNAYLVGRTNSTTFPVTTGAYQTTSTGNAAFVTKLNAAGNALVYSTYFNGASPVAIAVDAAGNAYLTGNTTGSIVTTSGAFQPVARGLNAPFVAKLNAAGSAMVYATYLGGSGSDEAKGLAVDTSGQVHVTGLARSIDFPTSNAFQPAPRGGKEAFLAKLNPTGTALVYSTYLGGTADDVGNGVAVDGKGQAHVAGMTYSNDFPVTAGAFQFSKGHSDGRISNAFITKFNSGGTAVLYSSYLGGKWCLTGGVYSCFSLGGDGIDAATAVAVDAAGYAYLGGYATSVEFPQTDPIQAIGPGGDELRSPFVAKVRPKGDRLVYSVVLGGRGQDERLNGLAVDRDGNAYAVGDNGGAMSDYPVTAAPLKATGNTFIFKLGTGKYPTTLQSSSNPASSTRAVTFTASVLNATPGGTVTFRNGSSVLGTAPAVDGAATFTTLLPIGVHKITAVYSVDGKVSPVFIQTVNPD